MYWPELRPQTRVSGAQTEAYERHAGRNPSCSYAKPVATRGSTVLRILFDLLTEVMLKIQDFSDVMSHQLVNTSTKHTERLV
jgi:hypothetical protein